MKGTVHVISSGPQRYPSNKSEEFPQIHQPWVLSLRNFQGISRESFPVTDSSEILEKFPRIGPQDERFLWDHSFETQFREIPEKFSGNFSPRNSSEFLQKYSLEIPEKFLGQEIPLTELREFPQNGLQEIPRNGLQEIPRTWFLRMGYEKFLGKAVDIFTGFSCERFLRIFADSQERFPGKIPGNFRGFSAKLLLG